MRWEFLKVQEHDEGCICGGNCWRGDSRWRTDVGKGRVPECGWVWRHYTYTRIVHWRLDSSERLGLGNYRVTMMAQNREQLQFQRQFMTNDSAEVVSCRFIPSTINQSLGPLKPSCSS